VAKLSLIFNFFFVNGIVGGGAQLDQLGTATTNRPIVSAPGDYDVGENEVLGENLPQCCFFHHKSHMLLGREPGPPSCEVSD
jgi:hypothetical protein